MKNNMDVPNTLKKYDNSNMTLLSICVPTFNRSALLHENLLSLLEQWNEKIEIIVSDNASTDETGQIVETLIKENPGKIHYFRQPKNLGSEGNFDFCFSKAAGDFVWILGDDDRLSKNCLPFLLSILEENQNTAVFFLNPLQVVPGNLSGLYSGRSLYKGVYLVCYYLTFISSLVFNSKYLHQARKNYDFSMYYSSRLLCAYAAFHCLLISKSLFIFNRPLIVSTQNGAPNSYNFYEVFVSEWHKLLFKFARPLFGLVRTRRLFSKTIRNLIFCYTKIIKKAKTTSSPFHFKYFLMMMTYFWFWAKEAPILLSRNRAE